MIENKYTLNCIFADGTKNKKLTDDETLTYQFLKKEEREKGKHEWKFNRFKIIKIMQFPNVFSLITYSLSYQFVVKWHTDFAFVRNK